MTAIKGRTKQFQRNEKLEVLLKELNDLLATAESTIKQDSSTLKYPILLIMGCARAGTTIIYQWLASTGLFAYPSNLLSRFYGAPYIGARVQQILIQYDHMQELSDFNNTITYESNLGKTKGTLAPNEFWYFWRRFFKFGDICQLPEAELKQIDHQHFLKELILLEKAFDKPLAMKGGIVNWHIPYLHKILDKVIFLYVKRDPVYNIQSIVNARRKFFNDITKWYAFQPPPEYASSKPKDPYEEIAGQVFYNNQAIENGLKEIPVEKKLVIPYEDFCNNPETYYDALLKKLAQQGTPIQQVYNGPKSFENSNSLKVDQTEFEDIKKAFKKFFS